MTLQVRTVVVTVKEVLSEAGVAVTPPTRTAVAAAVIANPFAGRFEEDLSPLLPLGADLGALLARRALDALGGDAVAASISSYGKGAVVGTAGELEHAAALIHPTFGAPVRAAIGGGAAIIPSTKAVAGPGFRLTMPLTNRHDIWEFDDMDAVSVSIDDAPRPDEVLVALAFGIGGRPLKRVRKP